MPDEHTLALREASQARTDFAALESDIEVIQAQLALLATRKELARIALGVIFGSAGIVILWIEVISRLG